MNANYMYGIYALLKTVREFSGGHSYDTNVGMAMMQTIQPISSEEQNSMGLFMSHNATELGAAFQKGHDAFVAKVEELVAADKQEEKNEA